MSELIPLTVTTFPQTEGPGTLYKEYLSISDSNHHDTTRTAAKYAGYGGRSYKPAETGA